MSNNSSPGWGLYQADVGAALDQADEANERANKWQAYAKGLEARLEE